VEAADSILTRPGGAQRRQISGGGKRPNYPSEVRSIEALRSAGGAEDGGDAPAPDPERPSRRSCCGGCSRTEFDTKDVAIPAEDLLRIDASWSIAAGLALVDPTARRRSTCGSCSGHSTWATHRVARALALGRLLRGKMGAALSDPRDSRASRGPGRARRAPYGRAHCFRRDLAFLTGQWRPRNCAARRHDAAGRMHRSSGNGTWHTTSCWVRFSAWRTPRSPPPAGTASDHAGTRQLLPGVELRTLILVWLAADDPDDAEQRQTMRLPDGRTGLMAAL
jgi:hypothetical protein